MGLKSKLAAVSLIGATLLSANAGQTDKTEPLKEASNKIVQVQKGMFSHQPTLRQQSLQKAYELIPIAFKAYEGKSFDERGRMRAEMLLLSGDATIARAQMKMLGIQPGGKMSIEQATALNMINEIMALGRPVASIDTKKPLIEQMQMCGLNRVADFMAFQSNPDNAGKNFFEGKSNFEFSAAIVEFGEAMQYLAHLPGNERAAIELRGAFSNASQAHTQALSHFDGKTESFYAVMEKQAKDHLAQQKSALLQSASVRGV